ncbi:hypothetical protein QWJ34_16180 [Saccharibacillus sp. CPCC 101409]|uniref:hypothetical protein n=1 Tax=Saccharibacillus sp. CPCC 101409 TaxID=3058041 RepID=UPI002672CD4A|nr:hypothetical protein [Saccharibacillus sp. CPCC 101409]MDO3411304.1 hypothetical protein [Saccharibacillus sp. CPCC 101409]
MSRSRRGLQQNLPFTAAFALVQALSGACGERPVRERASGEAGTSSKRAAEKESAYPNSVARPREADVFSFKASTKAGAPDVFQTDFMNTLSPKPLPDRHEGSGGRGCGPHPGFASGTGDG